MRTKTKAFHYYVCRVAFDRRQDKSCVARNVRADKLEAAIQREIRTVLTNPTLVLREMEQQREVEVDHAEIARLDQKLGTLRDSEQRLVRLYTSGRILELSRSDGQSVATLRWPDDTSTRRLLG